ncbi:hypothetical protein ACWCZ5_33650 [Streptomyces sp. NPDC001667]
MGQRIRQQRLPREGVATGAQVLGRLRCNRRTPVLTRLPDSSYLSVIGTARVRIIDARITVTCQDGAVFTGSYRLVTTLTDARSYPAAALVGLYHQRWEHESAYYALHHTIMNGRVLRSGDPVGVEQEMWALLTLYQALRTWSRPPNSRPGTDPDRCCFTIALQTARDQVVQAAGIVPTQTAAGEIGRRVLGRLLPPRRQRVSTRKVKSPISRYKDRQADGRPDTSRTVIHLDVTVLEPADMQPALPTASRDDRHTAPLPAPQAPNPRPRPRRPRLPMATARHRSPLRRHHPRHDVQTAEPLGSRRPHPQDRPPASAPPQHGHQPPRMTCENDYRVCPADG